MHTFPGDIASPSSHVSAIRCDGCSTVLAMYKGPMVHMNGAEAFFTAVGHFLFMFCMSAAIGVTFGLLSAVISFQLSNVAITQICFSTMSIWQINLMNLLKITQFVLKNKLS